MLYPIFAVMAPVLSCMAIGYWWAKCAVVDTKAMGQLVLNVGTPCLIVYALNATDLQPLQLGVIGLAALLVMLLTGLLAYALCRWLAVDPRVYVPGVVYSNNGNIGLPICLFAFGDAGLALAVAYFVTVALSHFSVGLMLFSGRWQFKALWQSPIAWSALAAIAMQLLGGSLPEWLDNSLGFIAGVTNPLMLVMLGISLAGLRLGRFKIPLFFALVRVLGGACAGYAVALGLGLSSLALAVVVVQASTASAAINYLLAKRYVGDGDDMAALVFCSTLMALLFIALLLPWLMA